MNPLLLSLFFLLTICVLVSATRLNINLNYEDQQQKQKQTKSLKAGQKPVQEAQTTVTNTHTGKVLHNKGKHATSKVTSENVQQTENLPKQRFFRKNVPDDLYVDTRKAKSPNPHHSTNTNNRKQQNKKRSHAKSK
jgi:hypothetical protein